MKEIEQRIEEVLKDLGSELRKEAEEMAREMCEGYVFHGHADNEVVTRALLLYEAMCGSLKEGEEVVDQ
ncbi:hypothetical protein IPA_02760 [Ignicoccus pacificus DSM 13166]|uniref:Uncharacterized protein n=1 Tax=Ignicoccus pacificus DSM 13166 TaxID=940294 RepID=A0A977PLD8_9CREN|nr:hypothetical protein IPA_02760 [Ignicoccus pacificus DSM 13166]